MLQQLSIRFCTYFKRIERFQYDSETYDTYTAFCLKSGCFAYRIGDGNEQMLLAGEMVICPPQSPFARRIVEPIELLMIQFETDNTHICVAESVKLSDGCRLSQDLVSLEECLFCKDLQRYPRFEHYAKDVLYMMDNRWADNTPFAQIRQYMHRHYTEPLQVEELAKRCGYSSVHFINSFKQYYGQTPKQYLAKLRLNQAKEWLMMTDKTSKEIACACGFQDELYFLRFFKQHTGLTPKQFRKENTVRM